MTSRCGLSIDEQIINISKRLPVNKIILLDDVVYSGGAIRQIINKFNKLGVEVVEVITSISTKKTYDYFNKNLKYGLKANYMLEDDVIDEVCERDFYFGIAGSGIMVIKDNELYKAPYFMPFGNPYERASIPIEYKKYFSISCLNRSIYLWQKIEELKQDKIYIDELPERIINTNNNDEVIKLLKEKRDKLCK